MKKLIVAFLFGAAGLLTHQAQAQTAPAYQGQQTRASETAARRGKKASATDMARMQRRMSMNPDEVKRDQQMEVLEARGGGGSANTSFGRASGPARQYERSSGGFTLKKFRDKRRGTARQKRGQMAPAPGVNPKGHPLKHKNSRHFLFF